MPSFAYPLQLLLCHAYKDNRGFFSLWCELKPLPFETLPLMGAFSIYLVYLLAYQAFNLSTTHYLTNSTLGERGISLPGLKLAACVVGYQKSLER